MMIYTIRHNPITGMPSVYGNGSSIPSSENNGDFRCFLEWNAQQAEPLDWQTPIVIEVPLPVPSIEERVTATEDAMLALLLG